MPVKKKKKEAPWTPWINTLNDNINGNTSDITDLRGRNDTHECWTFGIGVAAAVALIISIVAAVKLSTHIEQAEVHRDAETSIHAYQDRVNEVVRGQIETLKQATEIPAAHGRVVREVSMNGTTFMWMQNGEILMKFSSSRSPNGIVIADTHISVPTEKEFLQSIGYCDGCISTICMTGRGNPCNSMTLHLNGSSTWVTVR